MGTQSRAEQNKGLIKYLVLPVHMHDHHALSDRVLTVRQITEKKNVQGRCGDPTRPIDPE